MGFPDMSNEFGDWQAMVTLSRIVKTVTDYETVETAANEMLEAIIYPMKPQQVSYKPEGQRAWRWFNIITKTTLAIDDIVQNSEGVKYRIFAKTDYRVAGFYLYDIAEGWTI
jgi:hypothetical protein